MNNNAELLKKAEAFIVNKQDSEAIDIYKKLTDATVDYAAVSYFRLGEIANRIGEPQEARELFTTAFKTFPSLAALINPENHPFHKYIYPGVLEEKQVSHCPLCGAEGRAYWCYVMVTNSDFEEKFNPIRTWMYCEDCHHLYASSYPSYLDDKMEIDENCNVYMETKPILFAKYSELLNSFREFTSGNRLLEVGIGGGELITTAREMMFDTVGIDIWYGNIKNVNETFLMNNICVDFLDFESEDEFDIVCMGDVLEHITKPLDAIKKASSLLATGGILWISTPNFESAYSLLKGHSDPMKKVSAHLNYFSYPSLYSVLSNEGLEVVKYSVSAHYGGSMEVIAVKK